MSLVDAAALPEVACTVWSNVFDLGRLQPLDTILIHGGGSGIGTFAIQAAVAHGARVLTTARPAKHAALTELGAEVVDRLRDRGLRRRRPHRDRRDGAPT